MNKFRIAIFVLCITSLVASLGCSRDPNVRKRKYFESGQRYENDKKFREAVIQYSNALRLDKNYPDAHYGLGRTYLKMGSLVSAYAELLRTVSLQPSNMQAQLDLASVQITAHKLDDARTHLQAVFDKDPNNSYAYMVLANLQDAQGKVDEAIGSMQRAIALEPKRPEYYVNEALLQHQKGDSAAAEAMLKQALSVDPNSVTAVNALANLYSSQKRYPEAEQQFLHAIAIQPKEPAHRKNYMQFLIGQNRQADAEQAARKAKNEINDPGAYVLLAEYYTSTYQPQKAESELEGLVKQHKDDLQLRKRYIAQLFDDGQFAKAEELDNQILKQNSKDITAIEYKGRILAATGHAKDAIDPLQAALHEQPDSETLHFDLGVVLAETGDVTGAEVQWREALRLNPKNTQAYYRLGLAALTRGDYKQAFDNADRMIAITPGLPSGYMLRASAASATNDFSRAAADLQTAIKIAPTSPQPYAELGQMRLHQKQYAEAEAMFRKALELDFNNSYAPVLGLVELYTEQHQDEKSLTLLRDFLQKQPKNAQAWLTLGALLKRRGDSAGALNAFQHSVEADPANVNAHRLLAEAYAGNKDFASANKAYKDWAAADANDPLPLVALGQLAEAAGKPADAENFYHQALQRRQNDPDASNSLAYLLLQQNRDVDVAIGLAQTAHRFQPAETAFTDTLAWAYVKKGAARTAIDLLEDALRKSPSDPAMHYHLAVAFQLAGKKDNAKAELMQVAKLDPNYQPQDVKRVMDELNAK